MMRDIFRIQTPFFLPLSRRVIVVGIILAWFVMEVWRGEFLWAALVGAIAGYCIQQFFVSFDADAIRQTMEEDNR